MEKISNTKNVIRSLKATINKKMKMLAADAKDHLSLEDDAVEHAKAYRMLGWNWDQIDTILEDMEFEPELVKASIKRAQKYFEDTQKDGAFSMFVIGQLIKLNNGFVGKVLDKYPTKLQIKVFENNEDLMVSEAQIDLDASLKLKEAFVLRTTANELIKSAMEDSTLVVEPMIENVNHTLLAMSTSVLNKLTAAKKYIDEKKEAFKANKQVLSALGLEYYTLDDLVAKVTELKDSIVNSKEIKSYASIMTSITNVADVLDQFKNERDVLNVQSVKETASLYVDKVKNIIASVSKDVIPTLVTSTKELCAAAVENEKEQIKQKVSAVVDKINKK